MFLLEVKDLHKTFPVGKGGLFRQSHKQVHAVDGVSFAIDKGEVLAVVGESGCGKSTLALTLMNLETPTAGRVFFKEREITRLKGRALKAVRRDLQMIFQDPYESLNPTMTVRDIVGEPLKVHGLAQGNERKERVLRALKDAGLAPAESYLDRYPHELSGGQRQRVVIASALVLEPSLLLADEPVSMLDVSIRAEILNLLAELQVTRGVAILFITHDLSTAASFADRIAVMYLGRLVEVGTTKEVLGDPQHPYTKALLSVVPVPNPRRRRERVILGGDPPDPIDLPSGCRFHPRCPEAVARCREIDPRLEPTGPSTSHQAACILVGPDAPLNDQGKAE